MRAVHHSTKQALDLSSGAPLCQLGMRRMLPPRSCQRWRQPQLLRPGPEVAEGLGVDPAWVHLLFSHRIYGFYVVYSALHAKNALTQEWK